METLRSAWKNLELRRNILFTLLMLFIFRIGSCIPVPFINTAALRQYFTMQQGTALGFLNVLSGGAFASATIFALSVQPYINASIIIQMLCVAIPALEHISKEEGEMGKKKIENITKAAACVIGLIQAYGYYRLLASNGLLSDGTAGVWWKALIIILTFALGSVVIMLMGKAIDKKGLGNGISIILFAGIMSRLPSSIITTVRNVAAGNLKWWVAVMTYVGAILLVVLVVYVNYAERRIAVHYASHISGSRSFGGRDSFLPVRVSMAGVMPIIFAQSIATLPATIGVLTGHAGSWWARTDTIPYILIYVLLIIGFSYFYTSIIFNPIEIANNLKANAGAIPGMRPGKPTSEFLRSVSSRITVIGAIYLSIIAAVPMLISHFVPSVSLTGLSLGGTTVIIAVGVALEIIQSLEGKLQTRNYSGLFLEKVG